MCLPGSDCTHGKDGKNENIVTRREGDGPTRGERDKWVQNE